MSNPESRANLSSKWIIIIGVWLLAYWALFFTSEMPNGSGITPGLHRSTLLLLLPELYAALIPSGQNPGSGLQFLSQRFVPVTLGLFIIAAALAAGRLTLKILRFPRTDFTTETAIAGGVGLSLISLFTLLTGLAGWLNTVLYGATFLALIAAAVVISFKSPQTRQPSQLAAANPFLKVFCLTICCAFLTCILLGAPLPQTDFDVKEYHLGGPKEYFQAGQIQFLPHNVYTSFPFLTEMLILAGMVLRGDWEHGAYAGQIVLAGFAVFTAFGVAAVANRIAGHRVGKNAGYLAAAIYLSIPWTYRISIIAYTEGALCCYAVLALLAYLIWYEQWKQKPDHPESPAQQSPLLTRPVIATLFVIGILSGSAVSTKYTGLVQVAIPCLVATFVTLWWTQKKDLKTPIIAGFIMSAGVLVAFGPWMLKNLFETGNPVYPLAYSLFGGIDWNDELQAKWKAAHPLLLLSPGWNDTRGILYYNDWQSPLIFGFAPVCLLFGRNQSLRATALAAFILFGTWFLFTHRLDRFWVPMNPVMSVLAAIGLITAWGPVQVLISKQSSSSKNRKTQSSPRPIGSHGSHASGPKDQQDLDETGRLFLAYRALIVVLTSVSLIYNFGYITTGYCGYNDYLADYKQAWESTKTKSVAVVDSLKLEPSQKVLFIGEAALFNAKFPYSYSTVFDMNLLEIWTSEKTGTDEWKIRSAAEIRDKFEQENISYVFVNWDEILRYRTTYRYTNYVTPDRLLELEDLGVMQEISLLPEQSLRPWESVDPQWQLEVENWAPELKTAFQGKPALRQFQLFRVTTLSP